MPGYAIPLGACRSGLSSEIESCSHENIKKQNRYHLFEQTIWILHYFYIFYFYIYERKT